MVFSFLHEKKETPASLRRKAEELLARSEDLSKAGKGRAQSGENQLKRAGFEGDFRQFRDYRPGDRPQDIDWKRSARSDDTLMREREKTQQRIIDLFIQNDKGMRFRAKYETAGIFAMAFALWAKQRHDPIYFEQHTVKIDDLSATILKSSYTATPVPRRNAVSILLGDFTAPMAELEKMMSALPLGNTILLQIFDPAELDFPFRGSYIFENAHVISTINDTDAIRDDYQSALHSHIDALKSYCRKRHWHYDLLRTDQNFTKSFSAALAFISDAR